MTANAPRRLPAIPRRPRARFFWSGWINVASVHYFLVVPNSLSSRPKRSAASAVEGPAFPADERAFVRMREDDSRRCGGCHVHPPQTLTYFTPLAQKCRHVEVFLLEVGNHGIAEGIDRDSLRGLYRDLPGGRVLLHHH